MAKHHGGSESGYRCFGDIGTGRYHMVYSLKTCSRIQTFGATPRVYLKISSCVFDMMHYNDSKEKPPSLSDG